MQKYYYVLFTKFLKNTTTVLDKIEHIYSLLKNDTNFKQQLKTLKNNISDRINETQQILQNSQSLTHLISIFNMMEI